jgi:hypothetical protein
MSTAEKPGQLWLIATPASRATEADARRKLDEKTKGRGLSTNYSFPIPGLKVSPTVLVSQGCVIIPSSYTTLARVV